jgi:hypothetical protein
VACLQVVIYDCDEFCLFEWLGAASSRGGQSFCAPANLRSPLHMTRRRRDTILQSWGVVPEGVRRVDAGELDWRGFKGVGWDLG